MQNLEIIIGKALLTAKEILIQMLANGMAEPRQIYAVANAIAIEFELTLDQSIIVVENALNLI
jgi:hypothetical protein